MDAVLTQQAKIVTLSPFFKHCETKFSIYSFQFPMKIKEKQKSVYLIGIGGIGMSALARLYHAKGWTVAGSDAAQSELTDTLKKEGIRVTIGHAEKNITKNITFKKITTNN